MHAKTMEGLAGASMSMKLMNTPLRVYKAQRRYSRLAFAYVWFSGLREPLAKTAYRDIWITFTGLFVLLCIINTVVYVLSKKRAGRKREKE